MKFNIKSAKKIGAAFLGLAVVAAIAVVSAQTVSANNESGAKFKLGANIDARLENGLKNLRESGMQPQVMIGPNGKVLVRGAKVTAVNNSVITAQVAWGSFASSWTVDAANAKFLRHAGGKSSIAEVAVGNTISFSGMIDTNSSSAAVKADVIKNWSVSREDAPFTGTLQGELKAIADDSAPTTLTVEVKDKDYTVNVAAGTAILNKNWGSLSLSSFEVGDTVRFYGSIDGATANATVVRNVSR